MNPNSVDESMPAVDDTPSAAWESYRRTMDAPPTLWSTAQANDTDSLRRLLVQGDAAVDARDARGYSPLMLAAYSGSMDTFTVLLAVGADPNSTDLAGNSVLMSVAFKGHVEMAERLLAAGADRAAKNHAGLDARAFATMFGRREIVELLSR